VGKKDYMLGSSMWRISSQYDWADMLKRIATLRLKLLSTQTNRSAQLMVRAGRNALILDSADAKQMITIAGKPGDLLPLHCTAHGKALLAGMNRSQLNAILGTCPLQKYTKTTVKSLSRLSRDLSVISRRGFASDEGEFHKDIWALAAPIRLEQDVIVGSIGIVAACSQSVASDNLFYSEEVCKAAGDIGAMLSTAC
jgi:DNA-binding IclR family transcriptional regulator